MSDPVPAEPAPEQNPAPTVTPEPETRAEGTDPDTFPRAYVEELRREAAGYRDRAKATDTLAERLHGALVAATGRLADPADLPYNEAHLDDADALSAAIDELLTSKPHLASRRPVGGDIGQGVRSTTGPAVTLGGLLRARV